MAVKKYADLNSLTRFKQNLEAEIPTTLASLSDDSTHRLVTDTEKTAWNAKLDTSKVKTINSTTAGDVYDVTYINTMLGDIESLLEAI